jgi:hypothetical protein
MIPDTTETKRVAPRRGAERLAPATLYFLFFGLFLAPSGCTVVGALAHKAVGNPPVPAVYAPAKEPMLVLVENYGNPAAVRLDAQRLSLHVADELHKYHVAPVVDAGALEGLRERPEFATMKIEEVGRAAGAAQVLYINLKKFTIDDTVGGEMMKGKAEMRMRIVDAGTGHTRWPAGEPDGHTVLAETSWVRSTVGDREGASELAVRDQIARNAAGQIVRLFRKWNPDDEDQDLEETVH